MKLRIQSIRSPGELANERVVLRASQSCNIGLHVVFRAPSLGANQISGQILNPFWLPDDDVEYEDLVVVYTKTGTPTVIRKKARSTHFYYLGKQAAIYRPGIDVAVVAEIHSWTHLSVDPPLIVPAD